jgi:hypothetical protein
MTIKPKTVLVLRTVDKNGRAHGGFQWPAKGLVEAPDWQNDPHCGHGLHGWLRGEGDANSGGFDWSTIKDRLWQVVEVEEDLIVELSGKVKYPRGKVLFTGDQLEAVKMIQAANPGAAVIGGVVTAGYSGKATAGDYGKATAGDSGTATAGYSGTATAGNSGTATAGNSGTATAGDYGKATAGNYGKATAGYSGIIVVSYWDKKAERQRLVVGYPGENGIEIGKAYCLNEKHELVEVTK